MANEKDLELLNTNNGLNEVDVSEQISDENITPEMSEEYLDGKGGED